MKINKHDLLFGLLGLASMVVSALGYVYGHKPFTPENLLGVLQAAYQLSIAVGVIAMAAGLGERLLRKWQTHGLERAVVALGIGLGVLSLIMLVLGVTIGYHIWLSALLSFLALIFLWRDVVRWFSAWDEVKVNDGFEKAIALCVGLIVFFVLLTTLAPPLKFDALVYHLALPRMYLDAGQLTYIPENMFWGMPQLTEMLYLLAMQLGGVESASALGCLIGTSALGGIFGITKKYFDSKAAWMAVAALLAGESLSESLGWGYSEWTSILIGTGALVALIRWIKDKESTDLWLMGILSGFALSIKYTNGILLLCLMLVVFLTGERTFKLRIAGILSSGALTALVSFPWWMKNAIATGNPFYPLLFESGAMDATRIMLYRNSVPWGSWMNVILLPIQATVYGIEGGEGFSASIGPILLAFGAVSWLGWQSRTAEQKTALRIAWIITIGGMTLWAIASRFSSLLVQTRLYVVIFPAWAFLAGAGINALWQRTAGNVRLGRMAGLLALFMLGLNTFQTLTGFAARNPLGTLLGLETQETYIARNLGAYSSAMQTINQLDATSRVLMLWETRGYYCLPRCDSDEVIDRWVTDLRKEGGSQAVLQSWKSQGYTHVLVHEHGVQFTKEHDARIDQEEWRALETLFDLMQPQDRFGDVYTLYEIP